jgi:hypothetical protein
VGAKKALRKLVKKDAQFAAMDGAINQAWRESGERRGLVAKANAGRTQQLAKAAQARQEEQADALRAEDDQRRQHAEYVVKNSTSKEAVQVSQAYLDGQAAKAAREPR